VDYLLDAIYHQVFLYFNEHVTSPFTSFYAIDHDSWDDLKVSLTIPLGLQQGEDLHGYRAGPEERLFPHPAYHHTTPANRNYYLTRIATPREA
jgi:hypothetical protein